MIKNKNSGLLDDVVITAPEFFVLKNGYDSIMNTTENAFGYADKGGRKLLFDMRLLMYELFPNIQTDNSSEECYIEALEHLKKYLSKTYLPGNTKILFPGVQYSLPRNTDLIRRLINLGGHITISLEKDSDTVWVLLKTMTNSYNENPPEDTVILTDGYIKSDYVKSICHLWNKGVDATVCSNTTAKRMWNTIGFSSSDLIDIYNGILTVPGNSIIRCRSFDTRCNLYNSYDTVKDIVEDILKDELSKRFLCSAKGKISYRQNRLEYTLPGLGIFYPHCISNHERKIYDIFHGGAEYDIIAICLEGCSSNDNCIAALHLSAACNYLNNYYPVKAVPVFRDKRFIEHVGELRSVITDHSSFARHMFGGSILELTVADSIDLEGTSLWTSLLNAFFSYGGTAIKIKGRQYI